MRALFVPIKQEQLVYSVTIVLISYKGRCPMTNKTYNNIPVEILSGVFLTQNHPCGWGTGRVEVDWYMLKRDIRSPIPEEDAPCWNCLHTDCRMCSGDYPIEEVRAEELGLS